ncbi:DUF2971 domain-containing protein [Mesorhizobium sp. PAMC28654]|uniref:DUF2971 domain-containing protein n=1 Tax=Mesorhizobium sp. PAMC28654 TaxID=2880934 RepID=UPI001D0A5B12|nr:DUF2971 domain-containing protein [Mesorhizobium sp. PAMC28654]UDL90198.1 DUF2971 domain-containing protein [Mesorhizobium sp. PAMC28654]
MDSAKSQSDEGALRKLFLGPLLERYSLLKNNDLITLAHYTSAKVLLDMLEKKEVWMRNARCMNDFSEIDYAKWCIQEYFRDEKRRDAFRLACENCHEGAFDFVSKLLDGHLPAIYNRTYISCLAQHDIEDDANGRLSMWRGYGGADVAVSIVLRKAAVIRDGSGPYGIQGYPVQYPKMDGLFEDLNRRRDIMVENKEEISSGSFEYFRNHLFGMFQVLLATIKHPGFSEENEWRLIYLPDLNPSKDMEKTKVQIALNGMPQSIYKIPVNGEKFNDDRAVTVDELIQGIIVGPCAEAGVAIAAIQDALMRANHRSAQKIVHFCGIPYRERL